jgi:transcriptional antiterminator NusG
MRAPVRMKIADNRFHQYNRHMNAERRWHVVQCKPHQEERVAVQLREQAKIEVYSPRVEVIATRKTGKVKVVKPLFPSYLFARIIVPDEWKMVTYTRGVARLIGDWKEPSWIADVVIETIRQRENEKDRLIQYYHFKPRQSVFIRSGPLKDLYGIFERYVDDRGRVRILLGLLGYQASVELEAEQLGKV